MNVVAYSFINVVKVKKTLRYALRPYCRKVGEHFRPLFIPLLSTHVTR